MDIPQITDAANIPEGFEEIKRFNLPRGEEVTIYRYGQNLIWFSQSWKLNPKTQQQRHLFGQEELPRNGLAWVAEVIEKKFMRGPTEGGLMSGDMSYEATLDGEELSLIRGNAVGGPNTAGYVLVNKSRKSHKLPQMNQEIAFGDDFLFDHQGLDMLKQLFPVE